MPCDVINNNVIDQCEQSTVLDNKFLPPWTELTRKYLGTDKSVFRGVVQDIIYDVTAYQLAWRCHTQWRHEVVLWTTKTTSKSDYLLKIKAWEKYNQSLHSGRDKGIPSECPWFATSTTRQASSWIANHGHSDGIPLSLPECSDRFYYPSTVTRIDSFVSPSLNVALYKWYHPRVGLLDRSYTTCYHASN